MKRYVDFRNLLKRQFVAPVVPFMVKRLARTWYIHTYICTNVHTEWSAARPGRTLPPGKTTNSGTCPQILVKKNSKYEITKIHQAAVILIYIGRRT